MKKSYLSLLLLIVLSACTVSKEEQKVETKQHVEVISPKVPSELKRIKDEGILKVVVDYNSTNYFVYKGQPMGFQYELLTRLAKSLGVKLQIIVSNNLQNTFDGLNIGRFDLVAKNLTVTRGRAKIVDFTTPFALTRQVLVQRLPEGYEKLSQKELSELLVDEQIELGGKTVYVQQNTVFVQRLKNLSDEIGDEINIVEDSIHEVEQLIGLVAQGKIAYTVCDENIALNNKRYYPWIDISTPISFNQKISWAVRKNSSQWLNYLNNWIQEYKKTNSYAIVYHKYFKSETNANRFKSAFNSIHGGQVSEYDDDVKELSAMYNFDWRLVAAIVMQESNFNPKAESWVGAKGLMQLMPETANLYDVEDLYDVRENLRAGMEHLTWLDETFRPIVSDSTERWRFILASYNVGIGHVMDARKLAMKYGKNPSVWDGNVDVFIRNKSRPKYFNDPVVRWGYCRGEETYKYVTEINDRFQHYLNVLPDQNNQALVALPVLKESLR